MYNLNGPNGYYSLGGNQGLGRFEGIGADLRSKITDAYASKQDPGLVADKFNISKEAAIYFYDQGGWGDKLENQGAHYDTKVAWIKQIAALEERKKSAEPGSNANHVIHREANSILTRIDKVGSWDLYDAYYPYTDVPSKVNFKNRLAALKIVSAAKLSTDQAKVEIKHDPRVRTTIIAAKKNPALVENAEFLGEKAKEEATKSDLRRAFDRESGIYKDAAGRTASDLTKNPLDKAFDNILGKYKYLAYGGIALVSVASLAVIFRPYMSAANKVMGVKRRKRRRRRRSR
jgi:hypothetical protein